MANTKLATMQYERKLTTKHSRNDNTTCIDNFILTMQAFVLMQKTTKVLNMEAYVGRVLGRKTIYNLSAALDDNEFNASFPTTQSAVP